MQRMDESVAMKRRTFLMGSLTTGLMGIAAAAALGTACSVESKRSPTRPSSNPQSPRSHLMNVTIRRAADRGQANHGWLNSQHTFSFASYYDANFMGFRSLRVINQDRVEAARGFSTHPHRDMEIFSYVLEGALEHKDSMGNGRVLRPGEIQLMSAGTGVTHSEFNPNKDQGLHFLQIWIEPNQTGLKPSYTEWKPTAGADDQQDVVVISPDGRDHSAQIHQDAIVRRLHLAAGDQIQHEVVAGRGTWVQLIRGELTVGAAVLQAGDGASTEDVGMLALTASKDSEALLFDLG